jgi:general secretion pathway protein M
MSLAGAPVLGRPALSRIAALAVLAVLGMVFCVGPLAAYSGLIGGNSDALAAKAALLQRYQALSHATPGAAAPAGPALLYPDLPESQLSALLQEAVKSTAAAARVQVLGLQVLRGDALPGATRIGVRVRATGDMASIRSLLYAIETARPLLYPDNLQIQAHGMTPDTAPVALDFQLDISGFKADPAS